MLNRGSLISSSLGSCQRSNTHDKCARDFTRNELCYRCKHIGRQKRDGYVCVLFLLVLLALPTRAQRAPANVSLASGFEKRPETADYDHEKDNGTQSKPGGRLPGPSNAPNMRTIPRTLLSTAEGELRDMNDLLKIAKKCGPSGLLGRESFGGWQMVFPWSPLRTGTMCKKIRFSTTFPNEHDVLIFLAADRSDSPRDIHIPPIVWAESIKQSSFKICMHMPTLPAETRNLMQDRLSISWLALNKRGILRKYELSADQVSMDLKNGSCICRPLPDGMDPSLQTVLVTVAHPGVKYDNAYSSRGEMHSPKEAVVGWIQRKGADKQPGPYEVCAERPLEMGEDTIEFVNLNLLALTRASGYGGVIRMDVSRSRHCNWISLASSLVIDPSTKKTLPSPEIFVGVRLNDSDARVSATQAPVVSAWIARRAADGFTLCAEILPYETNATIVANAVLSAGVDSNAAMSSGLGLLRNATAPLLNRSIVLHWQAVPQSLLGGEVCQTAPAD